MDNLAILAKNKVDATRRMDIQSKIDDCLVKVKRFLTWQIESPDVLVGPGEALAEVNADDFQPADGTFNFHPLHLLQKIEAEGLGPFALHFALKKELKRYSTFIKTWQKHFSRQQERQAASRFACKVLKGSNAAPISRIKCANGTQPKDGALITTDPIAIDKQGPGFFTVFFYKWQQVFFLQKVGG